VQLNKVINGYNIGLTATRIGFGIILIGYIIYVIWQINKLKNIEKATNN